MDTELKKMKTLELVTEWMNHLSLIGARTKMRDLGTGEVLNYIDFVRGDTQAFLEYVYVANRVGYGLHEDILDKDTVLGLWPAEWWFSLWGKLEPLIQKERKRRKDKSLYIHFEWLIDNLKKEKS